MVCGPSERLQAAAERVLEVASELFHDRGINSVGVDTLAAEAGVISAKSSTVMTLRASRVVEIHSPASARFSAVVDISQQ